MPTQYLFQDKPPKVIPDKLFIDTSILLRLIIPALDQKSLDIKNHVENLFKFLGSNNKELATTTGIIQETVFKIIDTLVKTELYKQRKTAKEISGWTRLEYKNCKEIISKYLPLVERFYKSINIDYGFTVYQECHNEGLKYMKRYYLLPRDAFFVAKAINENAPIMALDRDYNCINELSAIYIPIPKKIN